MVSEAEEGYFWYHGTPRVISFSRARGCHRRGARCGACRPGAMGCILVIPAIACGAVSGAIAGSVYGALVTSDGSRGLNATLFVAAAVLGAFVWSAHRLRKGNIWSEGPDAMVGPDANWKAKICGAGTALMYCGWFGSMVQLSFCSELQGLCPA